ncbi:MAG: class IV adenylate cyclase [Bryobacterales bacterium]|nr:class IV adenylate cyclase [Bryobacterales bacterium]MBV9399550.1 class IV adenylate cyclase [Bryobacterales bacterium]
MAMIETEIKLRVDGAEAMKRRLEEQGFRITIPRVLQVDQVFDLPDQPLLRSGKLLRVRSTNGKAILTYKGPALGGRHKSREELEAATRDVGALNAILNRLGYAPAFRYEKYRTTFQDGSGTLHAVAALDETPIGVFLELEGPEDWIDRTAEDLGFGPGDYITASYGSLYREHLKLHGGPADMIFSNPS